MRDINHMIDDCIDQLADDRVEMGVEGIYELAIIWKTSGATAQSFCEICQYMEDEAAKIAGTELVKYKIGEALRTIREKKHGIIIH